MVNTLKGKITFVSSAVIIASMVTVLFTVYHFGSLYFARSTRDNIVNDSRLIANDISNALAKVSNDVTLLAKTPPITGIIRSAQNQGKDVQEQSTLQLWKKRLSSIFTSMLKVNPYYTQIRYIGVSDGGKELVRVNRTKGEIYTTPDSALQIKGNSTYFKKALKLTRGSINFSSMDYNKEGGTLTYPLEPTLRVITPIYDSQHKIFGMIVINLNIENYISQLFLDNSTAYRVLLTGNSGNELLYDPDSKDVTFKEKKAKIRSVINKKNTFVVTQNIYSDRFNNNKILSLKLYISYEKLSFLNSYLMQQVLLYITLIAILAILIIYVYCSKEMNQLSKMAQSISKAGEISRPFFQKSYIKISQFLL